MVWMIHLQLMLQHYYLKKNFFNFRFKIRVGTFWQSFRPPSLLLGQCPKFDKFLIWQPSLSGLHCSIVSCLFTDSGSIDLSLW